MTEREAVLNDAADWIEDSDGGCGSSYDWIAIVLRIAARDNVPMRVANRTAEIEIHGRCSED